MIKSLIKSLLTETIKKYRNSYRRKILENNYKNLSTKQIFRKIYDEKAWTPETKKKEYTYYSGFGSHAESLTKKYITAVKKFLKTLKFKATIVEIGCGDFKVSSQLVKDVKNFKALDIYEKLIDYNKKNFKNFKNVKFGILDLTKKKPPAGDICIIRCVFQHLSNKMIKKALKNIKDKYKFLIITEHRPFTKNYKPNLDIISGPGIRLHKNSGVDLSKNPFNLNFKKKKILCKCYSKSIEGYLETTLFKLK